MPYVSNQRGGQRWISQAQLVNSLANIWGSLGKGRREAARFSRMPYYRRRRSYRKQRAPVRQRRRTTTRRRTQAPRASSAPTKMTGTSQGDKYVLSQADPFDENVDGVKIPDANSQPSVPLKAEDSWDVSTGATYPCTVLGVNPSLVKTFYAGTPASATTWTWNAAYGSSSNSVKLTQLRSDFELFRPVAHAVRITSGLAPTAATGFLHVCVFTMATFGQTTWPCPTSIAEMQSVPGYKRIPIGRLTAEGLTVVNRPLDTTSQRYIDTDNDIYASSATNEFNVPFQWGTILIAVSGAPLSATPVAVENIIHVECIPRSSAISQATPAAKYNVAALAGASHANAATSPSALDSEKAGRIGSALRNAASAIGFGGSGKKAQSYTIGNTRVTRAGWPESIFSRPTSNVVMSDGIRNSAKSSGMFL